VVEEKLATRELGTGIKRGEKKHLWEKD